MSKIILKNEKTGHEIWCYGKIKEDSNFSVVCEDESYDGIIPGLVDENGNPPTTWKQVLKLLTPYHFKGIEEISTI